jgi:uncharacterized protein (DUF58 family)
LVAFFVVAFVFPFLFTAVTYLFFILIAVMLIDVLLLFTPAKNIIGQRITPGKLSNGDENGVTISISNFYNFSVDVKIIDEIPFQFQKRDFEIQRQISANKTDDFQYFLRPTARGEYFFGNLNVFVSSPIKLISRRFIFSKNAMVPSYPSHVQLQKFELLAFSNTLAKHGIKKVRRLGHTMEFEQIKEYVSGDDIRTLNWKATAKKNSLMINQFQDEKSQNVYLAIDKGRTMKMPFDGLSLLDYSVNATLVLSSIILKKQDKVGVFSFSKKVDNRVVAEKRTAQMQLILENLYNIKTDFFETDYSRFYADIKTNVTQRSLIILFTNFETLEGLSRQMQYLKGIAKNHLLVVVFFQNTELLQLTHKKSENIQEIYDKVIAEKFIFEKKLIVNELKKFGIYSVLTQPQNLTLDTINKYLEIKARGLL